MLRNPAAAAAASGRSVMAAGHARFDTGDPSTHMGMHH
jgi:hypothetical protein